MLISIAFVSNGMAQTILCNGAQGDPVVNIDFSRGSSMHGSAIPESTFPFQASGTPLDGSYTIAKSTAGMLPDRWHQITNHTLNDPDGYMMIVNASPVPSVFYETTITGLCPSTTYEFAAWIINLLTYSGIKPSITFTILTDQGNILASHDTGDIQEGSATDWVHPGFLFTMPPNLNSIIIRMRNNGPGGNGNDIAIDDITFTPCGPTITASIDNKPLTLERMCANQHKTFKLAANLAPGVYNAPEFLWQIEDADGQWLDLPEETTNEMTLVFDNPVAATYSYRLLVAEAGNINSKKCRTSTVPYVILVDPKPDATIIGANRVCVGSTISLATNGVGDYSWTGPKGFSSSLPTVAISNATKDMSGTYQVMVTNATGCTNTGSFQVTVIDQPIATVNPVGAICEGTSVNLNASGGTFYNWSPAAGLSATNIANPVASPKTTTLYTVTVSNGVCETSAQVEVAVKKNASVHAGNDKKILEGQGTVLEGVAGDDVDFFWSPAEGLDNPYKLNPIASPKNDMTYTLNAVSKVGCGSASDQVFVKVYKSVIVPNSFSPNGDGINDFWNITAIETYANSKVKIMNRYGQPVFESSGYEKPWNGKYKNEDLPAGVYYYIINLNTELKPLTGPLMIIR